MPQTCWRHVWGGQGARGSEREWSWCGQELRLRIHGHGAGGCQRGSLRDPLEGEAREGGVIGRTRWFLQKSLEGGED